MTNSVFCCFFVFFFVLHSFNYQKFPFYSFFHWILSAQLFCQPVRCFGVLNCRFPLSTEDGGVALFLVTQNPTGLLVTPRRAQAPMPYICHKLFLPFQHTMTSIMVMVGSFPPPPNSSKWNKAINPKTC